MAHQDNDLAPLLSEISIRREYWLVWHENLQGSPRLWVFNDWIDDEVRRDRAVFSASLAGLHASGDPSFPPFDLVD
ncbi:hypothetical protein [Marivita sp.]|uniref:hypothetical protein n=1 Tax=Marivita sp. TaxID=2003365 RepID=UPI003A883865